MLFLLSLRNTWHLRRQLTAVLAALTANIAFFVGLSLLAGDLATSTDAAVVDRAVDAVVIGPTDADGQPTPVDVRTADRVCALPGVTCLPEVVTDVSVATSSRDPAVGANGYATELRSWRGAGPVNPWRITTGRAPAAAGEVVVDRFTADRAGLDPGDSVELLTRTGSTTTATVVGVADFAGLSRAYRSAVFSTLPEAQRLADVPAGSTRLLATGGPDVVDHLRRRLDAPAAASGVQVLTGDEVRAEQASTVGSDVTFITAFVGAFTAMAFIAGLFTTANTLTLMFDERRRELGLLRLVGATPRQLRWLLRREAAAIGAVAAGVGILLGGAVNAALQALMRSVGLDIERISFWPATTTLLLAGLLGAGTAMLAAWRPTRRAARRSPLQALTAVALDSTRLSVWRWAAVLVLLAAATALTVTGVGSAMLAGFTAALAAAALLAAPLVRLGAVLLRRPLHAVLGQAGALAATTIARSPRRTAAGAAAVMLALALTSWALVVTANATTTEATTLVRATTADVVITGPADLQVLPDDLPTRLAGTTGVQAVTAVGYTSVQPADGDPLGAAVTDLTTLPTLYPDAKLDSFTPAATGTGFLADNATMRERGWKPGQQIRLSSNNTSVTLTLLAGIDDNALPGLDASVVLDPRAARALRADPATSRVFVTASPPTGPDTTVRSLRQRLAGDPFADVQTASQWASAASEISSLVRLLTGMFAMTILVALLGIAGVLTVAVAARTRDFGMLRAIGATRGYIRRTVFAEGLLLSIIGTVLGVLIGTTHALVHSAPDGQLLGTQIPIGQLSIAALLTIALGTVTGLLPAARAARTPPLVAIRDT